MSKIKAIIFDFGGVLVRTEDYTPRHEWDKRLELPTGSVERAVHHSDIWVRAQLGRVTEKTYWLGVAELLYIRRDQLDLLDQLRKDYFSGDRLNYRLINLIRDLKQDGYQVAILSNDSVQLETKLREELQIYDLFDKVLISAFMGVMKPDPTAYRVALQELRIAPHETVFIDDSLTHIRGAQTLGINTILYRPETDVREELAHFLEDKDE
jgi:epoxide hydrolase-like predicted phosphatase